MLKLIILKFKKRKFHFKIINNIGVGVKIVWYEYNQYVMKTSFEPCCLRVAVLAFIGDKEFVF